MNLAVSRAVWCEEDLYEEPEKEKEEKMKEKVKKDSML